MIHAGRKELPARLDQVSARARVLVNGASSRFGVHVDKVTLAVLGTRASSP